MSNDFVTPFGTLRHITRDGLDKYLLKCPGCGQWGGLDDDQLHGRVSVDHDSMGCVGHYHETHDFASQLSEG